MHPCPSLRRRAAPRPRRTGVAGVLTVLLAGLGPVAAGPALGQEMVGFDYGVSDLDAAGREAYETFLAAAGTKAFAVSAEGVWGWVAEAPSAEVAERVAVARCQEAAGEPCVVIAALTGRDADAARAAPSPTPGAAEADAGAPSLTALGASGREAYETFLRAEGNKAFAIGPAGAWAWRASQDATLRAMEAEALETCARRATAPCQVAATGIRVDDLDGVD